MKKNILTLKTSEIVKQITENHSLAVIKFDSVDENKNIIYKVRNWFKEGELITEDEELTQKAKKSNGWVILDAFTASGLNQVYNALSDEMKIKFDKISLNRLIDFMWKQVN